MELRLVHVEVPEVDPVLSPELALVDPELAAWANARPERMLGWSHEHGARARPALRLALPSDLPADRGTGTALEPQRPSPRETAAASAGPSARPVPSPPTPVAHTPPSRSALGSVRVLAIAVLAAGIGFAAEPVLTPDVHERSPVRTDAPLIEAADPAPSSAGPARAARPEPATAHAATASTDPAEREAPSDAAAPGRPPLGMAAPGVDAAPELGWLRVRGASHYRVELYRGSRQILVAFPVEPRLALDATWTHAGSTFALEPGSYRWTVRPGFGPRDRATYGAPTVSSTLVVAR